MLGIYIDTMSRASLPIFIINNVLKWNCCLCGLDKNTI